MCGALATYPQPPPGKHVGPCPEVGLQAAPSQSQVGFLLPHLSTLSPSILQAIVS